MLWEQATYYSCTDRTGSSSFITDANGEPYQFLQYLPFGESFISQRLDEWKARYTFSAKEKDEATGYHYFGARYYDSETSVWLSVDPMSDKYPHLSPYMYAEGNPVMLIDPDGMETIASRDGYTVDHKGRVERVDDTGGDKFDVLYTKEDYKAAEKTNKRNEYGNPEPQQSLKLTDTKILPELEKPKTSGEGYGIRKGYFENANKIKEAFGLFIFMSENTDVEWTIKGYKNKEGDKRIVLATFNVDYASPGTFSLEERTKEEVFDIHSHPSGSGPSRGDINDYYKIKLPASMNSYHGVFTKGKKDLYNYDDKGSSWIRHIGNDPKRFFFGGFKF